MDGSKPTIYGYVTDWALIRWRDLRAPPMRENHELALLGHISSVVDFSKVTHHDEVENPVVILP